MRLTSQNFFVMLLLPLGHIIGISLYYQNKFIHFKMARGIDIFSALRTATILPLFFEHHNHMYPPLVFTNTRKHVQPMPVFH